MSHELCDEPEMSLMIYQKLIENPPSFTKAYEHKSSLLMKMDMFKEASIVLNQLLKVDPEYSNAFAGIGICFDKLGKTVEAQRYYRKFLASKPFSKQAQFIKTRLDKLKNKKLQISNLSLV